MFKKYFSLCIKILIPMGIFCLIFNKIPISDVWQTILTAKILFVVLAFSIIPIQVLIAANQIKILTDHHQMGLTTKQLFDINFSIQFYNLFLPGTLAGGAVRWYKFAQDSTKGAEALAAIILNRLINMFSMAGLAIIAWAMEKKVTGFDFFGGALVFLCLTLGTCYILLFNRTVCSFFVRTFEQKKVSFFPLWAQEKLLKLVYAAAEFQNLSIKSHLCMMVYALTRHLLGALNYWLLAQSVDIHVSFISICWFRAFILYVALLPISVSGIGVRDVMNIFLLSLYHVPPSQAVALSFLMLARNLLWGLIGGIGEIGKLLFSSKRKPKACR